MHWRVPEVLSDGGASPFLRLSADKVRWSLSSSSFSNSKLQSADYRPLSTGSRASRGERSGRDAKDDDDDDDGRAPLHLTT
jgi:hypothetical protein